MLNYTVNLCELNAGSLPHAGGKGANLGELINAGLPVPPGFVVATNAYRAYLEESGLWERIAERLVNLNGQDIIAITEASNDISAWIEKAPMPAKVIGEVKSAFEKLSKETRLYTKLQVAVRSSATAEDLPSASFAGQHDTFLGVTGQESVLQHVKKCWISLWTPEAISYRISMNFKHLEVELAVVVQAMIVSEAAGVMFTANPVSGNRDEILISAGYGLGETVVGGLINPDNFIMTRDGGIKERMLGSKEKKIILTEEGTVTEDVSRMKQNAYCIGDGELKQLASLANLVEKHYGSPQDTEWALSQEKVYLLQARPITTISSASNGRDIPGSENKTIRTGKKTPFMLRMVPNWFPEPLTPLDFAYFCKRSEGVFSAVEKEDGCVAIKFAGPHVYLGMMGRLITTLLKNLFKDPKDLWSPISKEMKLYIKRMDASTNGTNDVTKLARLMEQAMDEFEPLFSKRVRILLPPGLGDSFTLDSSVKKALGKEETANLEEKLLKALPFKTAIQNQEMIKLAQIAAESGKNSNAFKKAFDRFLTEYGDRPCDSVSALVGMRTWHENPEFIHGLIDTFICDSAYLRAEESLKNQKTEYEAAKNQVEKMLVPGKVKKFEKSLNKVRNSIIVRDESSFFVEKLIACMRRIALKLGDMLAAKSVINETGDVFFLFLEELIPVAEGKLDAKEKIAKRKKAFSKICAAYKKGVHWTISTGSVSAPDEAENKVTKDNANTFHGVSASRSVYEGTVCIIRDSTEFNKLKKGDVMVCTYTSPAWTPLFKVASAVITEKGSPTSHAAIVAREYGIPAIVAIDNITNILKDGQKVRVDGVEGIVTLLQEDQKVRVDGVKGIVMPLKEGGSIHA